MSRSRLFVVWLIAAALFPCACSGSKEFRDIGAPVPMWMHGTDRVGSEKFDVFPEYRLGAGDRVEVVYKFMLDPVEKFTLMPLDVVEVKFPASPELNESQTVRLDGKISLAYVGEVQAAGRTPREIATELRGKLAGILKSPDLYVVVRDFGVQTREIKEAVANVTAGQTKTLTVRTDGFVTFPVIGDVRAAGKTVPELTQAANAAYARKNPNVKVDLLLQWARGAEITILGAVNRPGSYPINRPVSLLEALALAGGLRDDAKPKCIYSLRREDGHVVGNKIDARKLLKGNPKGYCMMVGMNDMIVVPRTRMSRASQFMSYLANILFLGALPIPVI